MPTHYTRLPNPGSGLDAERELDDAFDSDHDDYDDQHSESTPLTHRYTPSDAQKQITPAVVIPGTYDFERDRDYDHPPPGSPPGPSAVARPNDWGNSNGLLPSSPVRPPESRPSFFRRAVGALLPQHYARVPTEPAAPRPRGGGIENDGVFANVMAKPGRGVTVRGDNGEVYTVPEDAQNDNPPSYIEAQADAVPTYWETTVHAPIALEAGADMIVDDLPTGSIMFFVITAFVSYFFQFIGFVLTYLLHTTHAAKYGSRAGLGLTMIQYGFYSHGPQATDEVGQQETILWNRTMGIGVPMSISRPDAALLPNGTYIDIGAEDYSVTTRDWLSLIMMTIGWFLLLSSVIGFYRVKRWELSIRSASTATSRAAEQSQRDSEVRLNIERVFGILDFGDENEQRRAEGHPIVQTESDERVRRDFTDAGML